MTISHRGELLGMIYKFSVRGGYELRGLWFEFPTAPEGRSCVKDSACCVLLYFKENNSTRPLTCQYSIPNYFKHVLINTICLEAVN